MQRRKGVVIQPEDALGAARTDPPLDLDGGDGEQQEEDLPVLALAGMVGVLDDPLGGVLLEVLRGDDEVGRDELAVGHLQRFIQIAGLGMAIVIAHQIVDELDRLRHEVRHELEGRRHRLQQSEQGWRRRRQRGDAGVINERYAEQIESLFR